jgi:hypothetical protein
MRGRIKEIHKELQDLDPLCSPHLEERWIGGNIDLDLLSLFPQKYARIMGGMEEEGKDCKVNNGGERSPIHVQPKEEEGVFIPPPPHKIWPLQNLEGQIIQPKYGQIIRPAGLSGPLAGISGPISG